MTDMSANDHRSRRWWLLAFWLAVVFAVSFVGSAITLPKIPTWYVGLVKPSFTPPNWLFGPVWTLLYVLMAVAAWRIGAVPDAAARQRAIGMFCVQLLLNAIWSPVFFGLEAPRLGLAIIVAMDAAVVATLVAFWRLDRPAGIMLVPYLCWISYATALNAAIVALN
jgi:translocator protein